MSNNKQSIKLYTEEQVNLAFLRGHSLGGLGVNFTLDIVEDMRKELTPIELPSKEEIEEKYYKELEERREVAKNFKGQVAGRHPDMFGHSEIHHMVRGYLEAIQALRNKI